MGPDGSAQPLFEANLYSLCSSWTVAPPLPKITVPFYTEKKCQSGKMNDFSWLILTLGTHLRARTQTCLPCSEPWSSIWSGFVGWPPSGGGIILLIFDHLDARWRFMPSYSSGLCYVPLRLWNSNEKESGLPLLGMAQMPVPGSMGLLGSVGWRWAGKSLNACCFFSPKWKALVWNHRTQVSQ